MDIPSKVLESLRVICEEEQIDKLILFGSRAKDKNHERSDIDLAARFTTATQYFRFIDKLDDIKRMPTLLLFDVVDLNSDMISLNLLDDIKREGVVIYEKV